MNAASSSSQIEMDGNELGHYWFFTNIFFFPYFTICQFTIWWLSTIGQVYNINKATCSCASAGWKRPSIMTETARHESRRPIKETLSGVCRASNITAIQPSCSETPAFDWRTLPPVYFWTERGPALCDCSSSMNLCSVLEIKTCHSMVLQNALAIEITIKLT